MKYMINYKFSVMKRKISVFALLAIFCTVNISAQNANRERLEAYKIAFFTKRLNLTPGEAQKFWPLYNEYQETKTRIQLERQSLAQISIRTDLT
jgi:hypothetical protein